MDGNFDGNRFACSNVETVVSGLGAHGRRACPSDRHTYQGLR